MADANKKDETIQPSDKAFILNSSDICGNAKLIEEPIKGTNAPDKHNTAKTEYRFDFTKQR